MEKNIFIVIVAALVCACEDVDYSPGGSGGTKPITWVDPLYSTAIAFPNGYNWRRDSLGGGVGTEIIFFKDTLEMIRVNATSANEVSADPDRHRIIDGHLYTDFSSSSHTVLKKDGIELLRYSSREYIRSLIVKDSSVYTLGVPIGKEGWALRKNGQAVHMGEKGKLIGGLHQDGDSLCFGAAVPIEGVGSAQAAWRYYIVHNGEAKLLSSGDDGAEIKAVRSHQGQTNILVASGNGRLIWKEGEWEMILVQENSIPWRNCSFVMTQDGLYAHVQLKLTSKHWTDMFYSKGNKTVFTHNGHGVYALCEEAPSLCFASTPAGNESPIIVYLSNESTLFPTKYNMISPFALTTDGKKIAVGLNDKTDNYRPALIRGRDTSRFDFNGYFTRLSLP